MIILFTFSFDFVSFHEKGWKNSFDKCRDILSSFISCLCIWILGKFIIVFTYSLYKLRHVFSGTVFSNRIKICSSKKSRTSVCLQKITVYKINKSCSLGFRVEIQVVPYSTNAKKRTYPSGLCGWVLLLNWKIFVPVTGIKYQVPVLYSSLGRYRTMNLGKTTSDISKKACV